jgi:hypothetical protein
MLITAALLNDLIRRSTAKFLTPVREVWREL